MLVTGNLTGPHPIFHWKPCISGDLPHQSFESLVHPQRARSAGKAGLRNFSPLSPLSGPAETSNTVVLPFYHVFFYEHCDLKSGVYNFFGQLGPGDWQNPPSGCRRCWLRMDLSLPTCSQHSHTVYCPSQLGESAQVVPSGHISTQITHFFCSNPVLSE